MTNAPSEDSCQSFPSAFYELLQVGSTVSNRTAHTLSGRFWCAVAQFRAEETQRAHYRSSQMKCALGCFRHFRKTGSPAHNFSVVKTFSKCNPPDFKFDLKKSAKAFYELLQVGSTVSNRTAHTLSGRFWCAVAQFRAEETQRAHYRSSQMKCALDVSVISGKPEVQLIISQW